MRFIPTRVGKMPAAKPPLRHPPGSSPRVWGKLNLTISPDAARRFIPTRVGKIVLSPTYGNFQPGSSPRVWGKCGSTINKSRLIRFIPTRVGKIVDWKPAKRCVCGSSPRVWGKFPLYVHRRLKQAVHPHACGENALKIVQSLCDFRFIPTRVGKMTFGAQTFGAQTGSSPRVWGK